MTENLNTPNDPGTLTLAIGKKLRRVRTQRGLSLERLAALSGVSRSGLSHIELGQSAPTIKVLDKITRALTVPLAALLDTEERKSAFLLKARDGQGTSASEGGARVNALFPYDVRHSGRVEFYRISLAPATVQTAAARPAGTVDNIAVERGSLEAKIGDEIYRLGPGDALYFTSNVPHVYANKGDSETIAYLVTSYANAAE